MHDNSTPLHRPREKVTSPFTPFWWCIVSDYSSVRMYAPVRKSVIHKDGEAACGRCGTGCGRSGLLGDLLLWHLK